MPGLEKEVGINITPICGNPEEHRRKHPILPVFLCDYSKKVKCPYRVKLSMMPGECACVYREEN